MYFFDSSVSDKMKKALLAEVESTEPKTRAFRFIKRTNKCTGYVEIYQNAIVVNNIIYFNDDVVRYHIILPNQYLVHFHTAEYNNDIVNKYQQKYQYSIRNEHKIMLHIKYGNDDVLMLNNGMVGIVDHLMETVTWFKNYDELYKDDNYINLSNGVLKYVCIEQEELWETGNLINHVTKTEHLDANNINYDLTEYENYIIYTKTGDDTYHKVVFMSQEDWEQSEEHSEFESLESEDE